MELCKNCEAALQGLYCSACGQKAVTERLTVRHMLGEFIQAITNLERGFWYTARRLMPEPGPVVREYLEGRRKRFYHPVRYLFVLATLATVIMVWSGLFEQQQDQIISVQEQAMGIEPTERGRVSQQMVQEKIKPYLHLISLLTVPFLGLLSFRLFRKRGYNYAEHLAINAYWTAQLSLIGLIMVPIFIIFPKATVILFPSSILLSIIYYTFGFRQLFGIGYGRAAWKSFLTQVLGFMLMYIGMTLIAFVGVMIYMLASKIFAN